MFVKEPKVGYVKTRLAKDTGDIFATDLYKLFVKDLINSLQNYGGDFKLCACPKLDIVNKVFGNFNNFLQQDGDLGIKMKEAFEEQFDIGYEKIVLIGSDTPHITKDIVAKSLKKLDNHDIVIGPCSDGGYYLIAFNKTTFCKEVFENISWSTDKVLEQTIQKLQGKRAYLLDKLNDIDILDDLKEFYNKFKNSYFKDLYTIKFLKKNQQFLIVNKKGEKCLL